MKGGKSKTIALKIESIMLLATATALKNATFYGANKDDLTKYKVNLCEEKTSYIIVQTFPLSFLPSS